MPRDPIVRWYWPRRIVRILIPWLSLTSSVPADPFIPLPNLDYFDYPYAPSRKDWPLIVEGTGLDFVTTAVSWKGPDDPFVLPDGVRTTGTVTREEYAVMLGESKLLLGIGRPAISPSIYIGL
jgi:hypothetical protein